MKEHYSNNRDELALEARLRTAKVRLRAGFSAMRRHPARIAASVLYFILLLLFLRKYPLLLGLEPLIAKLTAPLIWICVPPLALVLYLLLIIISVTLRHTRELSHDMYRAGLVNRAGEPPMVVSDDDSKLLVLSGGIPLADFSDNQDKLEAAINRRITRIEEGPDKRYIQLHTAPGDTKLPTRADLPKLPEGNSVIALGQTLDGPLTVDLAVTPHMLIGGSTGSGKTYLVKSVIAQALAKDYEVYLSRSGDSRRKCRLSGALGLGLADILRSGGQLVLPVVIPVQLHGQAVIFHRDILGSEDIQPLFARNLNIQASEAVGGIDSCVLVALHLVGLCAVHIGVVGPYSRQQGLLAQGIDIKSQLEKIQRVHNGNTPFL